MRVWKLLAYADDKAEEVREIRLVVPLRASHNAAR